MASTSSISLCSQASILCGEGEIESFTEDNGTICGTLYDTFVEGWLSVYPWTFTKQKTKLSRLSAAPTNVWTYAFQLASDRMTNDFAVYDSDAVGATPIRDFDIQGSKLLANATEIWVDYGARPDEADWPPYFRNFVVVALASVFAIPLTDDASKAALFDKLAFGNPEENRRGGLMGQAMLADSQAKPSSVVVESPLIDARFS